jgi:hypothetical protein
MSHWFDNPWHGTKVGEALLAGSVEQLLSGWRAPAFAERWQAAIRQIQAPVNLADILRSRTLI